MNILLFGADGQLGWQLRRSLCVVGDVTALTRSSDTYCGDLADEAGIARVAQTVPMQRLAEPSDIGEACLWVASPQASYLSGTNLTLHGGGERPAFLAAASVNANASTPH